MLISDNVRALPVHGDASHLGNGAIAGTNAGIVTKGGTPSSETVALFDAESLTLLKKAKSNSDGHYLFWALNENKQYLVMVRDEQKGYEPFAWDWITPDTTLTAEQQLELAKQIFGA